MKKSFPLKISVCIPLYRCEKSLRELYTQLKKNLDIIVGDSYELIFVDDCSPMNDWEIVKELVKNDEQVKGFKLSKNFGQHPAIFAGLSKAKGEWIIVMDGDLQDDPKEIPNLYKKALQGNSKKILARRIERKDSLVKRWGSKLFYKLLAILSGAKLDSSVANFGIYHNQMIEAVLNMEDRIKYFPAMAYWVGFETEYLDVDHGERTHGNSSYNLKKLFNLAFEIIISFSEKPLKAMIVTGVLIATGAFILGLYYLWLALFHKLAIQGWASLIILIFFSTGLIILCLGIVGIYIGKIFESVKKRPIYIFEESLD